MHIITKHPIAIDSNDHLIPHGAIKNQHSGSTFFEFLKVSLPHIKAILDLGTATGLFVQTGIEHDFDMYGIDGTDKVLNFEPWKKYYQTRLFNADLRYEFSLQQESTLAQFDLITAWDVMEHLSLDNINTTLSSIFKHLKVGGLFMATIEFSNVNDELYHTLCKPRDWWVDTLNKQGLTDLGYLEALNWVRQENKIEKCFLFQKGSEIYPWGGLIETYKKVKQELDTHLPLNRASTLYTAIKSIEKFGLEGAIAEVGVGAGGSAKIMAAAVDSQRPIHLFDEFYDIEEEQLAKNLDGYNSNFLVYQGTFPQETFEYVHSYEKFILVHLDTHSYQSTLDGLGCFFPRLLKQGIIIIDDYELIPEVTKAVDDFMVNTVNAKLYIETEGQCLVNKFEYSLEERDLFQSDVTNTNQSDVKPFLDCFSKLHHLTHLNPAKCWYIWKSVHSVERIKGDLAECGCAGGGGSKLIFKAGLGKKRLHVFDTFTGIPDEQRTDAVNEKDKIGAGAFATHLSAVRSVLADCNNVMFHKGLVPDTLNKVKDELFSFVHLDMDLYIPTLAALNFFWDRLAYGGIIMLDDARAGWLGIDKALDEFVAKNYRMDISYPSQGQCRIIKVDDN